MAIKFHPDRAIYDGRSDTVRVPALDGSRLVVCAIAHEAICKAQGYEDRSAGSLLAAYRRFRQAFHLIANFKYRAGRIEPDGIVLVSADDFSALDSPGDEPETFH